MADIPIVDERLTWIQDGELLELYYDGWFICSPKISDLSPEAIEVLGFVPELVEKSSYVCPKCYADNQSCFTDMGDDKVHCDACDHMFYGGDR